MRARAAGLFFGATLVFVAMAGAQPTGAFPDPAGQPTPSAPPEAGAPPAPSPQPAAAAPTPSPPPPAPAPSAPIPGSWQSRYQHARERLLAGDFSTAARELDELARSAPGPHEQGLALELGRLAREWARRGLTLVRGKDVGEAYHARAVNERTTDEIAVLYLNAVLYGVGTGGWLAVQTEPASAAGAILPALALAGVAPAGVALLDHNQPLGYGVPQSIVSGMYIGLSEGIVWATWNQAQVHRADEWSGKTVATLIWGSASAGALVGGSIGTISGTTPGRASFVGSTTLWAGLISGLTVAAIHQENETQDEAALLGAGIGMNVGLAGGMLAAGPVSPTIGRVRFLDLGAISGGLVFGGLYLSFADDNPDGRTAVGVTAAGLATGLGTAWFLTDSMDKDLGFEAETQPSAAIRPSVYPTAGGMGLGAVGYW